ncbi:flagellin [Haematobacter massiliensis]|uniref:Flagellin n=1 Tax=Haematobacter massiliensis TaxID=195105 RepID=A0A086YAH9_9RHOB|nr:flagellin [Haematobacter massiliensis]KFI31279.1 flagellin [Haematobacter massiliensis]OWJ87017.1 flagellin [Haematobacter massiliensis]QBJ23351.1 flagellin [Haematobacter massiliensis]
MSSILTNSSAMVALQTLKGINSSLAKTQDEISTGKSVASAKDNAAVWAISKTMESDVASFKAVSDGLSQAKSTIAVARTAVESIAEDLTSIKGKIVAAQQGTGSAELQKDIEGVIANIKSTISTAQFSGISLLEGTGSVDYLASLDRSADGSVTPTKISVEKQDLSIGTYTAKAAFTGSDGASTAADTFATTVDGGGASTNIVIDNDTNALAAGDRISVTIGDKTASYTVTADDVASSTPADLVAVGLKGAVEALGIEGVSLDYDSGTPGTLVLTNNGTGDLAVSGRFQNAGSGGLGALDSIDVSTAAGAASALTAIEGLLDTVKTAGATLGSTEGRVEKQANFISKLSDALTQGIGAMVDADMEEASARLQALQVQQQLGIQALSIANSAPQNVLSLFR